MGVHRPPRTALTVTLFGLVSMVAGCGSSPTGSAPPSRPAPRSASTTPAGSTGPPPLTMAPTSTPTSALACTGSHLGASAARGSGAGGQEAVVVVLRNTGTAACTVTGYPTAIFLDAAGGQLAATTVDESGAAPTTVTLVPGGFATTTVWTGNPDVPAPSYCQPVTTGAVTLTLPGVVGPVAAPVAISVCSAHAVVGTTALVAGSGQQPF